MCFAVLKRLTSRKVLQPHAGTTLRFHPHNGSTPQHDDDSSTTNTTGSNGSKPTEQQHQQKKQKQTHELEFQTDLLMLVAGNSRQMGRTVAVCPDALLDDGLLDFTVLSGSSLAAQVG